MIERAFIVVLIVLSLILLRISHLLYKYTTRKHATDTQDNLNCVFVVLCTGSLLGILLAILL